MPETFPNLYQADICSSGNIIAINRLLFVIYTRLYNKSNQILDLVRVLGIFPFLLTIQQFKKLIHKKYSESI